MRMAAQDHTVGHHDLPAFSFTGPSRTIDPAIAATVLAAYTPPTRRAGSWPRVATEASASGKLAPQRIAAGNTAKSDRTPSTCRLIHGLDVADGLIGQYGNDCASVYAVHAMQ